MKTSSFEARLKAMAPVPAVPDPDWADAALARIVSDPHMQSTRRAWHRPVVVAAASVLAVGSGTTIAAAAGVNPLAVVKDVLSGFAAEPDAAASGIGAIGDPQLVAQIQKHDGTIFAVWIATTSTGEICTASTEMDGPAAGASLTPNDVDGFGCAEYSVDPSNPGVPVQQAQADQVGNFFTEAGETILYGVSPYPDAVQVLVRGAGVGRRVLRKSSVLS